MKKQFLLSLLAVTLAVTGYSQTNTNIPPIITGPGADVISFMTGASSNWMVAPYGIYDSGSKEFGGGIALAYKLNDFVVPTLRFDYLNKEIWMPSADVQLQLPVTFFGKITAIPFVFAGIATPISGRHADNGTAVGMFGSGMAIRVAKKWDVVGDVESWQGAGFSDLQYRFGFIYKF